MIIPSDPGLIADFGVFQKSWGKSTIFTNTAYFFEVASASWTAVQVLTPLVATVPPIST
jgi:hypothetical protein